MPDTKFNRIIAFSDEINFVIDWYLYITSGLKDDVK